MLRRIISIYFTVLFVLFLTTPTIVAILDSSVDVSVIFATSEEEENGCKKSPVKELIYNDIGMTELDFGSADNEHDLEYYLKKYPSPHLKLTSPPPQLHIL